MNVDCPACNDTHMVYDHRFEREIMCSHCPVPCDKCRTKGIGPYCSLAPCTCSCHSRKLELENVFPKLIVRDITSTTAYEIRLVSELVAIVMGSAREAEEEMHRFYRDSSVKAAIRLQTPPQEPIAVPDDMPFYTARFWSYRRVEFVRR